VLQRLRCPCCKLLEGQLNRRLPTLLYALTFSRQFRASSLGRNNNLLIPSEGMKQGGKKQSISSGWLNCVLFSVFINNILTQLSRAVIGCHIGWHFEGSLTQADDIVLVAPHAHSTMCPLLLTWDNFAADSDTCFIASRPKCMLNTSKMQHSRYLRSCNFDFTINASRNRACVFVQTSRS
jgi:hypothetical protein